MYQENYMQRYLVLPVVLIIELTVAAVVVRQQ